MEDQSQEKAFSHNEAVNRINAATEIIKSQSDLLRQADNTYTSWDDQDMSVQNLILGAMIDFSNSETKKFRLQLSDLEAENARLREALENIVNHHAWTAQEQAGDVWIIADKALNPNSKD